MPANNLFSEKTADLLSEARRKKGFTQRELADLTGISLRSIQRIENADVVPRAYTLKLLTKHLGIDLEIDMKVLGEESIKKEDPVTEQVARQGNSGALKQILSVGFALLLVLIGAAFLSQSRAFPETTFELFSFWAGITSVYLILMILIWRH